MSDAGIPASTTPGRSIGVGDDIGRTGMTWPPSLPFALALERARALDKTALAHLYRRFLPVVYRYTLARAGDVHAAEDATAETFFAMIEQISSVRAVEELGFVAWLLGIARNKVAQHFRRQRQRPESPVSLLPEEGEPHTIRESGDPLDVITARESWSEVVAALDLLTEEQRTVVLYRCVLGYSADEVGALMGKQAGTVRALQFRALASLSRHLDAGDAGFRPRREGRRQDAPGR